jgi:hypothetical protein
VNANQLIQEAIAKLCLARELPQTTEYEAVTLDVAISILLERYRACVWPSSSAGVQSNNKTAKPKRRRAKRKLGLTDGNNDLGHHD